MAACWTISLVLALITTLVHMYLTQTHTYTSRMYYGRKRGFKPVSVYSEEDMDTFRGESDDGTHTPSLVPRPRGRREK